MPDFLVFLSGDSLSSHYWFMSNLKMSCFLTLLFLTDKDRFAKTEKNSDNQLKINYVLKDTNKIKYMPIDKRVSITESFKPQFKYGLFLLNHLKVSFLVYLSISPFPGDCDS